MAAIIDFLKQNDSYLYPITLTTAVYDLNGKTLDTILNSYLPLAGGTMTGAIKYNTGMGVYNGIASDSGELYLFATDYEIDTIMGGGASLDGGWVTVGKDSIDISFRNEYDTTGGAMTATTSDAKLAYIDTNTVVNSIAVGADGAKVEVNDTTPTDDDVKTFTVDVKASSSDVPTNKTYINMSPEQFDFGRVDYDSSGNELPPQDGDAIIFQYYDSANAKYRTAMSIDGLNGSIYVAKKISSDEVIKAKYFTSTTPIEITIGSCTKTWDGHSPLSFTLDEINGTAATAMAYSDDEDVASDAVVYSDDEDMIDEAMLYSDEEMTTDETVIDSNEEVTDDTVVDTTEETVEETVVTTDENTSGEPTI